MKIGKGDKADEIKSKARRLVNTLLPNKKALTPTLQVFFFTDIYSSPYTSLWHVLPLGTALGPLQVTIG